MIGPFFMMLNTHTPTDSVFNDRGSNLAFWCSSSGLPLPNGFGEPVAAAPDDVPRSDSQRRRQRSQDGAATRPSAFRK